MTRLELFMEQRRRRFGTANPERIRLAHWEYMVRSKASPYWVRDGLGVDVLPSEPDWCFDRMGMSRTPMPDGRIICIAGEHEDSYDPDFCIYNEVVVLRPAAGQSAPTEQDGEVEIYGYPEAVFQPTDFHSATLIGEDIYLVGSLGYEQQRRPGETPVFRLDTRRYSMTQIATSGPCPGWIWEHYAEFDAARNAIVVRGGKRDDGVRLAPHHGAHRFLLAEGRWEVISENERHRRFVMTAAPVEEFEEPTADAFKPSRVPYAWLGTRERGVDEHSISVQQVRVIFREFYTYVEVLVEGELPDEVVSSLLADVSANLSRATRAQWAVEQVESFDRPETPDEMGKWLEEQRKWFEENRGNSGGPS
jgi:hypothetical protein